MIALIGEKELWRGFEPLGVKVFEADSRDEVIESVNQIKHDKFAFVLISEGVALKIEDILDSLYKEEDMNVVLLPALDANEKALEEQLYYKRLKAVTEKAMGVDIL